MRDKTLLLIDDSLDHLGVLGNLTDHFHREGINLNCNHLNPNDRSYWDDSKNPDINKVLGGINSKLQNRRPDLIIVDYVYSGIDKFNGLTVIEKLRDISKYKTTNLFMISGKRDQIVRKIFLEAGLTTDQKVSSLAKIINFRIEKFLDKNFKDEAISLLRRKTFEDILPSKLREREMNTINLFNPKFRSLTIKQLADKIENQDAEAIEILDEMFEMTISHYSKINENLQ